MRSSISVYVALGLWSIGSASCHTGYELLDLLPATAGAENGAGGGTESGGSAGPDGSANGGSANGGSTNGGSTNGGAADGGRAGSDAAGSTASAGTANGGFGATSSAGASSVSECVANETRCVGNRLDTCAATGHWVLGALCASPTAWCSAGACGAPPEPLLVATVATTDGFPRAIAADAVNLYWSNQGASGTIMKAPLSGGAPVVLASAQGEPVGIAVDSDAVYWPNYTGATVMKEPLTRVSPFYWSVWG